MRDRDYEERRQRMLEFWSSYTDFGGRPDDDEPIDLGDPSDDEPRLPDDEVLIPADDDGEED